MIVSGLSWVVGGLMWLYGLGATDVHADEILKTMAPKTQNRGPRTCRIKPCFSLLGQRLQSSRLQEALTVHPTQNPKAAALSSNFREHILVGITLQDSKYKPTKRNYLGAYG